MNYQFNRDMIWVTDQWIYIQDYLQEIINDAAFSVSKPMSMTFVNCSNSKEQWKYPSIRVSSESDAELVELGLFDLGVPAQIDLYEDDDGDGDGGRPIIRKIWSVAIPSIILKDFKNLNRIQSEEIIIECSSDLDNAMYNESI